MNLSSLIIGPVVTEKAEKLKLAHTYVLEVKPEATKIDIRNALRKYYDAEVQSIRVLRTRPKTRALGAGKFLEKRARTKRMIVTLTKKSKALDLSSFRTT